jgi:hypothetical protein
MGSKVRRLYYSIVFKVEVVNYTEKHGNRAAERRFGSPPTGDKMRIEAAKERFNQIDMDKDALISCAAE